MELETGSILETDNRGTNGEVQQPIQENDESPKKTTDRGLYKLSNLPGEKETRVEKSPSENSDYYRVIVDIKFADDEDEELKIDNEKRNSCSPRTIKNESNYNHVNS